MMKMVQSSREEEFRRKFLKQIDNEKRANLIMSRMQKQMKKPKINGIY